MVDIVCTTNGQWWNTESHKAMSSTIHFFVLLSIFNILAVSIDRYLAVFHPFWYHAKATCETHLVVAIAVYAMSIITFIPLAITAMKKLRTVSWIYITLMGLSLMTTSYYNLKIFSIVKSNTRQVAGVTNGANQKARQKQEKNKAVIIAIITVLFFICYTPFTVHVAMTDFDKTTHTHGDILGCYWTTIFVLLNSMLNPIVYYVRVQSVRNAFKQLIFKWRSELDEI